jgi:hypothetical protein
VFKFPSYKRDANQNNTYISSHPLEWPESKVITTNAGEDVVKQEPLYTAGGNSN